MTLKKATIRDVAAAAGVSVTTVSHVLNGVDGARVAEKTRARVQEAAEALSYSPSPLAKGLRSRHTKTIGFLSDNIATTPHAGKIILGAQEAGLRHGWVLLVFNTGGDPGVEADGAGPCCSTRSRACCTRRRITGSWSCPRRWRAFRRCCWMPAAKIRLSRPSCRDEVAGGCTAVTELLRSGHRRIGFTTNRDDIPATQGRLKGYQDALRDGGIGFDPRLVAAGESEPGGGYLAARTLLSLPDPPTALFCFNDRMAMGAYRAAAELGLRIPADLSVIGFDNPEIIADGLYPGLTTVALPGTTRWASGRCGPCCAGSSRAARTVPAGPASDAVPPGTARLDRPAARRVTTARLPAKGPRCCDSQAVLFRVLRP